jgi:acyl carrier protein
MKNKSENDIYKLIADILETDELTIKKSKKLSQIEEWDSLNHLNILIKLDVLFKNKVNSISEMGEADSVQKIIKLLKENKLIS